MGHSCRGPTLSAHTCRSAAAKWALSLTHDNLGTYVFVDLYIADFALRIALPLSFYFPNDLLRDIIASSASAPRGARQTSSASGRPESRRARSRWTWARDRHGLGSKAASRCRHLVSPQLDRRIEGSGHHRPTAAHRPGTNLPSRSTRPPHHCRMHRSHPRTVHRARERGQSSTRCAGTR